MRIVKKILKWALRVVLILAGLLALLSVLAYIPPVQDVIINKAAGYVSRNMGLDLDIERLRLRFPLTLAVDNTLVSNAQGDTILHVGKLRAGVAVMPLLRGAIEVRRFRLENTTVDYRDSLGTMILRGTVGYAGLRNTKVNLNRNEVDIRGIALSDASLDLYLSESPPDALSPDSVAATSAQDTIPWKIVADKIDLERFAFDMHTSPEVTELSMRLDKGRVDDLDADLARREITAKHIKLDRGDFSYLTDTVAVATPTGASQAASPAGSAASQPTPPGATQAASPAGSAASPYSTLHAAEDELSWTVRVGRVDVSEMTAAYGVLYGTAQAGFDPDHIRVSELNLRVDSLYNRGGDISAAIRSARFKERSGIGVTSARGTFAMDSEGIRLKDAEVQTADSKIYVDAYAGAGILDMSPGTPFEATLDASLASSDIFLLYPVGDGARQALRGRTIRLKGDLSGTPDDIVIRALRAEMAPDIVLSVEGEVHGVMNMDKLTGDLRLNADLRNTQLITTLLPDDIAGSVGLPGRMGAEGSIIFGNNIYTSDLHIVADDGYLDVKGTVDLSRESYNASVAAHEFPLGSFLPADSLGLATLTLSAEGRGFDLKQEGMIADIDLNITRFDYLRFSHRDISAQAQLADNKLTGSLRGENEAIALDMNLTGQLGADLYTAQMKGRVDRLDLRRMGLTDSPVSGSGKFDISASSSPDIGQMTFGLYAAFDSLRFAHDGHTDLIPRTIVNLSTTPNKVRAELRSGDLTLDFRSPSALPELAEGFAMAADTLMRQIGERNMDFRSVEAVLPTYNLDVSIGRNNIAHSMLREDGYDFNKITITSFNADTTDFRMRGLITGFRMGDLALDTLNVGLGQRNERFSFYARLANRPGNIEQLALIYLYGTVMGDSIQANFNQRNRNGEKGFVFGVNARLQDSSVRMSLYPDNPIFAYDTWRVNRGNFIEYRFNNEFYADLRLENQTNTGYINIQSADDPKMPRGSILLDISELDIGKMADLMPAPPPIGGMLSSNIVFGMESPLIAVNGTAAVRGFTYARQAVGDVNLTAATYSGDAGLWNIDATLGIDQKQTFTVQGTYNMPDGAMNLDVGIPGFPMAAINAFMPANTITFGGTLNGNMRLTGTTSNPDFSGSLGFDRGQMTVSMIGTTFGISSEPVRISRDRIRLRDFGLIAPNNSLLALDGSVDLSDLSRITADLTLFADNFQAVNAPRNRGSEIYGLAAINADMTIKGVVDALVLRGDMKVLRSTDIVYTPRDSPLSVDAQTQDIVTFISFADSSALARQELPSNVRTGGMDMLINVDIDNNVQATINLSDNGNDRIELTGEGSLTYTMNNQGDTRLTGRYTLSGGTVVYNPPIPMISQKFFTISEGSFLQWTGDVLNPELNINATETMRTAIAFDEGTETVSFNITVMITGTLERGGMNITFDLDAPENLRIKYDLASMTAEQRSQQAISLMLTNTYTGPSATTVRSSGFNANDAINSFLTQEFNQWARNSLPGIDLSVGIESEEYEGGTHNNYTYQVSKRLFNDRMKVTVGGSVSDNANVQSNLSESFIQDIMIEYRLTKRDNMFLKFYRLTTFDMLEGEIVETGGGFLLRKRMERLGELFNLIPSEERREARERQREYRDSVRREERRIMRDTSRRYGDGTPEDSIRRAAWRARRDSMERDSSYRPAPRDPSRFDREHTDSLRNGRATPPRNGNDGGNGQATRRRDEAIKEDE